MQWGMGAAWDEVVVFGEGRKLGPAFWGDRLVGSGLERSAIPSVDIPSAESDRVGAGIEVDGHEQTLGVIAGEEDIGAGDGVAVGVQLKHGEVDVGGVLDFASGAWGNVAILVGGAEIVNFVEAGGLESLEEGGFEGGNGIGGRG